MFFRNRSDLSGYKPLERSYPLVMPEFGIRVNPETSKREVYKKGDTNVYAQKQEALQDTLIYNLIDRVMRTGDKSLLGENLGGFIDVVGMPKNLMEAENIRLQSEQLFNSLPIEERRRYNNDISEFLLDVNKRLMQKTTKQAAAQRDNVNDSKEGGNSNEGK